MEMPSIPAWVFTVEPYDGESLSHFLGRFRQANFSSVSELGAKTGLGGVLSRWEKFRLIPPPTHQQLAALAEVVQVDVERLRLMLPPPGVGIKHEPIRLCAACYAENPCHQMKWQFKDTRGCDRHYLYLLSECPYCGARFPSPAVWLNGSCHRCFTPFDQTTHFQKPVHTKQE